MTKVIVADGIDADGIDALVQDKNFQLVFVKDASELQKEISDADALLVRSKTKVTAELLDLGKKLRFVGRAGVGIDNIDVPASSKRGIVVENVPGGNTISAAEHTFAMILALARNIPAAHATVKGGGWSREKFTGIELQGKTLGLLGFGRIGKEVARRALSFEMKVLAYDPFVSESHMKSCDVQPESLEAILKTADYISLHMPANDQTKKMINAQSLAKMKPDVRLVNCARGDLIDEAALIQALKDKKIKGAALDVFSSEPLQNKDFLPLENVILTPHLGASTEEAQVKVAKELAVSLKDFFDKGIVRNAVNLPSIDKETLDKVAPYLSLTEKMGRFISQISEGGMQEIKIEYVGDFAGPMRSLLTISVLRGVLSAALGENKVNWVNAQPIAKERGIKIEDTALSEGPDFQTLVTIQVKTDKQTKSVAGTILSDGKLRIVRVDGMSVDVLPDGHLLVLTNQDRPGVVGFIGTVLGENKINIAEFQVGRKSAGGEAVSILRIDSAVTDAVLKKIQSFPGITHTWVVNLSSKSA